MNDTEQTVSRLTKYRRARRAAGLCAYPGCELRSEGFHCWEHAKRTAAWQRDYRERVAAMRRLAALEARLA